MDEERNTEVPGTVTAVTPLTVLVDGADTACPADKHAEVTTLAINSRVKVQDRAPRRPIVVGTIEVETTEEV